MLETRLRNTGQQGGGGGSASSNSGGLAGTGLFVSTFTQDLTLPFSKVLLAGSSTIVRTDATSIYIDALTGSGVSSQSGGLAGTGFYYVFHSSGTGLYPQSRLLTQGSSVVIRTDSTAVYIDAVTNTFTGSGGLAGTGFYYIVGSNTPGLPISRILSAGSSVVTRTDATNFYIDALTNTFAGSSGLAGTGPYYLLNSGNSTLLNSFILKSGSSVTIQSDSTAVYITALTPNVSLLGATKESYYYRQVGSTQGITFDRTYSNPLGATAQSTATPAKDSMHCVHFIVTKSVLVDFMGISFQGTGANALHRLGIYSNSSDTILFPFQAIKTSAIIVSSANQNYTQFQVNQTLSSNSLYWLVYHCGTNASTVRSIAVAAAYPIFGYDSSGGSGNSAPGTLVTIAQMFSNGLPSTAPTVGSAVSTASPPALCLRMSI